MRKIIALILVVSIMAVCAMPASIPLAAENYDYSAALKNSILFYDANKCGKDVDKDNYFSWRKACHTTDGSDVGVDLTGGFHDAGDHVKFGLAQAYTASVLGWSLYEFRDVLDATGNTQKLLSTLKYFTDYFLKSHPDPNTFYYQVGDGILDHAYWGSPETQTGARPTVCVANPSKPASDILGNTSGALTLMYINYKDIDPAYADRCLKAAKELYTLGKTYKGKGDGQHFYQSSSYYDDLAWAALWLYVVEGNQAYLEEIKEYYNYKTMYNEDPYAKGWTVCWDDMYLAVSLKLTEITGDPKFKAAVEYNFNQWKTNVDTTPGGLKVLHYWGALRYAAAQSMISLLYYRQTKDESLKTFAKSQIDYILGSNPLNMSYMIGFGSKWPQHYHHRAAHPDQGGNPTYVLTGALVGGPNTTDQYKDNIHEYQYTEVAIDYNAGLVGALAGMIKHFGDVQTYKLCDINGDGAINSTDLTLLKRDILGIAKLSNTAPADINKDGLINSTDYTLLKRVVLKIIPAPV
ncbi:MAG: glycoside hydrolase family 9 protein [Bacillota bacterium]